MKFLLDVNGVLAGSPGGRLLVSGILQSEHAELVRDAEAAGFRVAAVEEEEWWSALLAPRAGLSS